MRRVYGTRSYKKVVYSFQTSPDGRQILIFEIEENPLTYVKAGIHFDSYTGIGVVLNITTRNFIIKNSRLLTTLKIGEYPKMRIDYYKYLGKYRNWGFDLNAYGEYTSQTFYSEDFRATSQYQQGYGHLEAKFQRIISRNNLIGVGIRKEYYYLNPKVEGMIAFKGKTSLDYAYLYYEWNTLNKKLFPTRGLHIQLESGCAFNQTPHLILYQNGIPLIDTDTTGILHLGNYIKTTLQIDKYVAVNKHHTLMINIASAYYNKNENVFFNEAILGGTIQNNRNQFPVMGILPTQIRSTSFSIFHLGYQWEFVKNLFVIPRGNLMYYDYQYDNVQEGKWMQGAAMTFGYASGLGPINITMMYSPQIKKVYPFINLGFYF